MQDLLRISSAESLMQHLDRGNDVDIRGNHARSQHRVDAFPQTLVNRLGGIATACERLPALATFKGAFDSFPSSFLTARKYADAAGIDSTYSAFLSGTLKLSS